MLLLLTAAFAIQGSGAPESGYLRSVEYLLNDKASSGRSERIWFDSSTTRRDLFIRDLHTSTQCYSVTTRWTSFPACGRIIPLAGSKGRPFVEEVRDRFRGLASARQPEETGKIDGRSAWKYAVEESKLERVPAGSIRTYQGVFWVWANSDFPLVLKHEVKPEAVNEIVEMRLGEPIPAATFDPPQDLKPIKPESLPKTFRIVVASKDTRDGVVTHEMREIYEGNDGEVTVRQVVGGSTSEPETITHYQARVSLGSVINQPVWRHSKSGGPSVPLLNFQADPIVSAARGQNQTCWVIDHDQMGTITIKREDIVGTMVRSKEIVELSIG